MAGECGGALADRHREAASRAWIMVPMAASMRRMLRSKARANADVTASVLMRSF